MPFQWNQGTLHKHIWGCSNCDFVIEFNTKTWAYKEIKEHKKNCTSIQKRNKKLHAPNMEGS